MRSFCSWICVFSLFFFHGDAAVTRARDGQWTTQTSVTDGDDVAIPRSGGNQCWDSRGFRTVESCMRQCGPPTVMDKSLFPLSRSTEPRIVNNPPPIAYKVSILHRNEYKMDGASLVTDLLPQTHFDANHYKTDRTGRAFVCYQMDEHFIDCDHWELELNEYDLLGNLSIYVRDHQDVHGVGSYILTKSGNAYTCVHHHEDKEKEEDGGTWVTEGHVPDNEEPDHHQPDNEEPEDHQGDKEPEHHPDNHEPGHYDPNHKDSHVGNSGVSLGYSHVTVAVIVVWEVIGIMSPFL